MLNLLEERLGKGRIKTDEPLVKYTTLKIGGPANFFFAAQSKEELIKAITTAISLKIPYFILGGGSNILVSDRGIEGLVIRNETRSIEIVKRLGSVKNGKVSVGKILVEVDSGVLVNQLVRFCCDQGLKGLECHLGLPGTVGGAMFMNSKWTKPVTYIGDVVHQAKLIDKEGKAQIVTHDYFQFGYDQSILQKTHETVVSVTFLLTPESHERLWEVANSSMEYRKTTQPMGVATAGCTFRNIPLTEAIRVGTPNRTTSSGFLVDQVGLKNHVVGHAKFSEKHANFILNLGGATAQNVKYLIDEAKKRVRERFKVEIEPEIILLGEFD